MGIDDLHAANLTKFEASKSLKLPKFLILRFSSIGDIVLTSPVIRCLKEQVQDAEIHYLTKKSYASVLMHHPLIDKLWTTDGTLDDVMDSLKAQKFDYIIDLHNNLRSIKIKRKLKVKSFSFRKLNIQKWMLVNLHINKMPPIHIVDRYMETLQKFKVKNDLKGLDFYSEPGAENVLNKLPATHQQGYVAIAIGAQHTTKMMPSDKIVRVIKALKYPVVLLGGKEDKIRSKQIEMGAMENVWNVCGELSLGESAQIVKAAKVVLTHDTGLMHIAAAFHKPIVSVWGNTVPEFGMTPYFPQNKKLSKIMEVKNLSCRPCSKIGYDRCPKGHFNCMSGIDNAAIVNAIKSFL
ncbi:MAG: glycosyltransferase family 9 protein [Bacteroidetes bacterium]|nr:glycosyltransferase family 9 protein [Bacteroidota bacterium]